MSPRLTWATAARVLRQLVGDHRTIGLILVVPCVLLGLLAWVCSVEGATLDWIDRPELPRDTMRELLVKMLGGAMRCIEELDPDYRAPEPVRRED